MSGKKAVLLGDQLAPHSKPKHSPHPRTIASGASTVFINGLPVATTGGAISCGGVTIGSSSVVVGDTHTPAAFSGTSEAKSHSSPLSSESRTESTGNHRGNDQILANRDVTNVAKLYDLYRDDGRSSNYRRIYVNGPGTIDGLHTPGGFEAPEDLIGLGLGIGPEGGHDRIEIALRRMRDEILGGEYNEVVFWTLT